MLLAASCSFATLCFFCAALKGLTRVENRTSGLHQLSQLLIFTQVPMVTKEQKIGQQWTSEEQTYWLIVPINEVFIYTLFSHLSVFIGIISTGKNNLVSLQKYSHYGNSVSPKLSEFSPLMLLDLIWFNLICSVCDLHTWNTINSIHS